MQKWLDADEEFFNFPLRARVRSYTVATRSIDVYGGGIEIPLTDAYPSLIDGTDFGVATAAAPVTRTFTIQSVGVSSLSVPNGVQISGPHAGDFTVIQQPASSISTSSNFQIRFTPGGTGLRTATVTIANNSSTDEGVYTFAIQGTGAGSLPGDSLLVLPTAAVLPETRPAGTLAEQVVADRLFEGDARLWLSEEWLEELSGSPSRRRSVRPAREALFAGWQGP